MLGFLKRNRFRKLKRDEVVDSIISLENELTKLEEKIQQNEAQIQDIFKKGRLEKSKEIKIFHAKRINLLQQEKSEQAQKGMYLLYNIRLLNKLKDAIDNQTFIKNSSRIALPKLLSDQKNLAKYLNKALNMKIKQEEILTNADVIFNEVESEYFENKDIYDIKDSEDMILSMFEINDDLNIESESEKNSDKKMGENYEEI